MYSSQKNVVTYWREIAIVTLGIAMKKNLPEMFQFFAATYDVKIAILTSSNTM